MVLINLRGLRGFVVKNCLGCWALSRLINWFIEMPNNRAWAIGLRIVSRTVDRAGSREGGTQTNFISAVVA